MLDIVQKEKTGHFSYECAPPNSVYLVYLIIYLYHYITLQFVYLDRIVVRVFNSNDRYELIIKRTSRRNCLFQYICLEHLLIPIYNNTSRTAICF